MSIQKRHRGGERNTYERNPKVTQPKFTELSEVIGQYFIKKLEWSLPDGVTFFYNNSTVIAFEHTSISAAYLLDFYPLDIDLSKDEVQEIQEQMTKGQDLREIEVVRGLISEQIQNIVDEVNRVKSYHPDSELTLVFGPADTLDHAGTPAKPIYMFLLESDSTFRLETESSFVVLPNDEMSKAYMED